MTSLSKTTSLLLAWSLAQPALANEKTEKEELLKLKNTTLTLIELLVKRGVLDQNQAGQMLREAEEKAGQEAGAERQAKTAAGGQPTEPETIEPDTLRVTYVPDFVKDEIRKDVRKELREEVVKDVKAQAREEKWGIPAALPDWLHRITLSGDFRFRYEKDMYGQENQENSHYDWPAVNRAGGITKIDNPFRNTTVDRDRERIRLRLALDAQITDSLKAGLRVTSSNDRSPISTHQTLGQYGQQYEVALDRAFLQYDYTDGEGRNWLNLWGGRFANPWLSADSVFDPDINFEGAAASLHLPFGSAAGYRVPNPVGRQLINLGVSRPNEVFLTMGYFPLQDIELSSHDKWMWGAQTGLDWVFAGDTRLRTSVAWYDYQNVHARPNALGSRLNDWTAPQFFNKGNSLTRISNDGDANAEPRLVGLASDFNLADAVVSLDYSGFGATHVMLTGNATRNLGFDRSEILRRTGQDISPKINAFQVRLDVGHPEINRLHDWNLWFAYKYVERDAVLDAFTESNFHLAGTDAKGWIAGLNYGVAKNTWFNARWLSSQSLNGPPLDIDVLLLDINTRL